VTTVQPNETNQPIEGKPVWSPKVWTLIVLTIGFVLGVLLAIMPRRTYRLELFRNLTDVDVVVSTMGLALLVALLYVYAKTYSETRARFALGLFIVLGAFLFQAVLTSPVFSAAFDHIPLGGLVPYVLAADAFETFAFGAFFYLSVQ